LRPSHKAEEYLDLPAFFVDIVVQEGKQRLIEGAGRWMSQAYETSFNLEQLEELLK